MPTPITRSPQGPVDIPANQASIADMQAAMSAHADEITADVEALEALTITYAAAATFEALEAAAQQLSSSYYALRQKIEKAEERAQKQLNQAAWAMRRLRDAGAAIS